jgi:hypothetical protein
MTEVQKQLGTKHHFTKTYCQWAKGTVEAVCRQISELVELFSLKAFGTARMAVHFTRDTGCTQEFPIIASCRTNATDSIHLTRKRLTAGAYSATHHCKKSLPFIKAQKLAEISKFTTQVEQLHSEVTIQVSRQRRKQMEAHNAHTHLMRHTLIQGDYVLRAVPNMKQHKLLLTWKGPYVVDKVYANNTLRLRSLIKVLCETCTRVPYIG